MKPTVTHDCEEHGFTETRHWANRTDHLRSLCGTLPVLRVGLANSWRAVASMTIPHAGCNSLDLSPAPWDSEVAEFDARIAEIMEIDPFSR